MWCKKIIVLIQYSILYDLILKNFVIAKPYAGENIALAMEGEFPFAAGITKRVEAIDPDRDTICTGSLVSIRDILTAEHCVEGELVTGIQIVLGSVNIVTGPKYYPAWWLTFLDWARYKNVHNGFPTNDVCIIRLTQNAVNVIPAKISYLSYKDLKKKTVVTMGWGQINNATLPRMLRTTNLNVLRNSECVRKVYAVCGDILAVDKNLLCADREPYAVMMAGDSGGPLLYRNKIVAISRANCPMRDIVFHPGKINLYTIMKYYKKFVEYALKSD